jgi:hypothetical protein
LLLPTAARTASWAVTMMLSTDEVMRGVEEESGCMVTLGVLDVLMAVMLFMLTLYTG